MHSSMKNCLLRFVCFLCALSMSASPAFAVIAGGMVSNTYHFPSNANGYNSVSASIQVTDEPGANGNTFYAHQFYLVGDPNGGGYTGIQQGSNSTKIAIFSIWNVSYTSSEGSNCRSFGGEGTGVTCQINYAWSVGVNYTFSVAQIATNAGTGNSTWRATVTNTRTGVSTTIGDIYVPTSYGKLQPVAAQFVENFTQGTQQYSSCSQVPATTVAFRSPLMDGVPVTSASTTTYGDCASIARSECSTNNTCIATINQNGIVGTNFLAQNAVNHYCADTLAGGTSLGLYTCAQGQNNANQILSIDASNRLFLSNRSLCLQANGSNAVLATTCTGGDNQAWLYMPNSKAFLNVGANQCLNAAGGGVLSAMVNVYDCNQLTYQQWTKLSP